ncbi:hypothetical protein WMF31_28170 [Sorangium sp. So ce1036]|uniref:hypothetical protein n=1 Tax=Sorangium sp. So ce1036 TaxID=3133328 RepID=UPI003F112407
MIRLVVRSSAELDIREAVSWYDGEEAGLDGQFVDELRYIVRRIGTLPSQFTDVGRGVQRALLKRFSVLPPNHPLHAASDDRLRRPRGTGKLLTNRGCQ